MLSFEEARSRVLAEVVAVGRERVPMQAAVGRVLAEPIVARGPFPPFSASAMDGYAVDIGSFEGDGPWTLEVLGESRMGALPPPFRSGTACRIFTGAGMPEGASLVVMQEDVVRDGALATFAKRPPAGAHVRRAGEDLREGDLALDRGTRLGPFHIALAASLD